MKVEDVENYLANKYGYITLSGYRYLCDICCIYQGKKLCECYKKIAEKYNTNPGSVERNIRSYKERAMKDLSDLPFKVKEGFPNSECILAISSMVKKVKETKYEDNVTKAIHYIQLLQMDGEVSMRDLGKIVNILKGEIIDGI